MKEIWKDIKGYEGLYQISNLGKVKNIKRLQYDINKKVFVYIEKEKMLKPSKNKKGYLQVVLQKKKKRKSQKVHRLVAEAFISNPNNLPIVNHKDENKQNNCVDNLEWCNNKYNCNYGSRNTKLAKKVNQYTKNNIFVKTYESMSEASKLLNIHHSHISDCCLGKRKSAGGYVWKYANK